MYLQRQGPAAEAACRRTRPWVGRQRAARRQTGRDYGVLRSSGTQRALAGGKSLSYMRNI
jgi:hypothetical protein